MDIGLELGQRVLEQAAAAGASAAEVMMVGGESLSAGVRLGEIEKLKSARERRLGTRVFVGQRAATASTADLGDDSLRRLVTDTVGLARLTAPDPMAGLPRSEEDARTWPELDLADANHRIVDAEQALATARAAEAAALKSDSRIKNSEGAEFNCGFGEVFLLSSAGFSGSYLSTSFGLSVAVVAQDEQGEMQRDSWYSANRHLSRLMQPEEVGLLAARRALRRLGARKIKTTRAPVVFEPEVAAGLIRTLAAAASGTALYKRSSFLLDQLGEAVAAPTVTIVDDATVPGLLGSRPFDGEGLPTRRKCVVEQGVLRNYLLDCYSARKLNLRSSANAARAVGEAPGVSAFNLHLQPGSYSPAQIVASVRSGLLVTELIGFGINPVTGDYSRGASGLWIDNGEIAFPVQEITIAGNLKQMFQAIEMVGDDLVWHSSSAAPTLKIGEMTIAGS